MPEWALTARLLFIGVLSFLILDGRLIAKVLSMNELEPDLLAHFEAVAELDIEISQGFNPSSVLKRPGIHGVKTDISAQGKYLLLGGYQSFSRS